MGCSCSDYRTRELGHSPKTFSHGRHSSSQDLLQLRAFLRRNVSPLGEWRSGTHLEPNRPSERSRRPGWGALTDWDSVCSFACQKSYEKDTSCPQAHFWKKLERLGCPAVNRGNSTAPVDPACASPDCWGLGPGHRQCCPNGLVHPPQDSPLSHQCSPATVLAASVGDLCGCSLPAYTGRMSFQNTNSCL